MTVINRHNYESYFLLWVDGELSDEEQVTLDRFVAENPDLAEELSLLKSTQLQPAAHLSSKRYGGQRGQLQPALLHRPPAL